MGAALAPALPDAAALERSSRLGRIEVSILEEIGRRGGIAPRCALVDSAFPKVGPRPPEPARSARARERLERWYVMRADAESTVSRAIASLARKGLVVVQRGPAAGRTLIQLPGLVSLPTWEMSARADDVLAGDWQRIGTQLLDLSVRARRRAASIRIAGVDEEHAAERTADVEALRDACRLLLGGR
ncbi:MAG TPA: hypothetical protein VFO60_01550 [Candidatus Dormibacteraeota bacterium]|nr:hypothetical protein [Candidatus Dormibacteraeota bacterium]